MMEHEGGALETEPGHAINLTTSTSSSIAPSSPASPPCSQTNSFMGGERAPSPNTTDLSGKHVSSALLMSPFGLILQFNMCTR